MGTTGHVRRHSARHLLAESEEMESLEAVRHRLLEHCALWHADVFHARHRGEHRAISPGHLPQRIFLRHPGSYVDVGTGGIGAKPRTILHGLVRVQHLPHVFGRSDGLWYLHHHLLAFLE